MSSDLFDDEYDPLAPLVVGEPTDDHVGVHKGGLSDHDEELGTVDDGGFGGGNGLVRIWFDDDGKLTKVRISPVWFRKLQPGQSLDQAFRQAFMMSSLQLAAPQEAGEVDESKLQDIPPFSHETIDAFLAEIDDHHRRWDAALAEAVEAPREQPRNVTGKSNGVTLTLDEHGHPHSVVFEEQWLDETQVGSICINVVAAAHKAYAKYVPMTNERLDELERFRAEHEVLLARFHRLFNPRDRR